MYISELFRSLRRKVPFPVRVEFFRLKRTISLAFKKGDFTDLKAENLSQCPYPVFAHKSRLIRDYPEPWYSLQQNKIVNLKLIIPKINMTLLPPGKKFSFWKIAGRTSKKKGFLDGMTLIDGEITSSNGGGLCQLSNALFWAALHSGFEIIERHRHSFDIFPDTERKIPFGSGATVFYNYVDLVFKNNSDKIYLFKVYIDNEYLHVEIYSNSEPEYKFEIIEENHEFEKSGDETFRKNEIFRMKKTVNDEIVSKELICKNRSRVLYDIQDK